MRYLYSVNGTYHDIRDTMFLQTRESRLLSEIKRNILDKRMDLVKVHIHCMRQLSSHSATKTHDRLVLDLRDEKAARKEVRTPNSKTFGIKLFVDKITFSMTK